MTCALTLPSGLTIPDAMSRLRRFCKEEYAYYDALPAGDPDQVEPMDILVTIAVNAYITNAAQARRIHRGLARRCDGLLSAIPSSAALADGERWLAPLRALLHAAAQTPGVLIPVATKVLHRKRPALIPMLDNVLLAFYLRALGQENWLAQTQDKRQAATVAMVAIDAFRADLLAALPAVEELRGALAAEGYPLTVARLLEILVWTETEPRGHYRAVGWTACDGRAVTRNHSGRRLAGIRQTRHDRGRGRRHATYEWGWQWPQALRWPCAVVAPHRSRAVTLSEQTLRIPPVQDRPLAGMPLMVQQVARCRTRGPAVGGSAVFTTKPIVWAETQARYPASSFCLNSIMSPPCVCPASHAGGWLLL